MEDVREWRFARRDAGGLRSAPPAPLLVALGGLR